MGLDKFFNEIEADIDYNHVKENLKIRLKILKKLASSYSNPQDLKKLQYITMFIEEVNFFQLKNDTSKQDILKENLKWCNKKYKEYLASLK